MTCVNCAQAINKKVKEVYSERGLIDVKTTVMTEKSKVTFDKDLMTRHNITSDMVRQTVASTGKTIRHMNVIEKSDNTRNRQRI